MLGVNQSLKHVDLSCCHISKWKSAPWPPFLQALSTDDPFKEAAPLVTRAFADALKENMALKALVLDWNHQVCRNSTSFHAVQEIEFYLDLNKAGRGAVLSRKNPTTTRQDWVDALIENSSNRLDVLFYFIRANPSICGA